MMSEIIQHNHHCSDLSDRQEKLLPKLIIIYSHLQASVQNSSTESFSFHNALSKCQPTQLPDSSSTELIIQYWDLLAQQNLGDEKNEKYKSIFLNYTYRKYFFVESYQQQVNIGSDCDLVLKLKRLTALCWCTTEIQQDKTRQDKTRQWINLTSLVYVIMIIADALVPNRHQGISNNQVNLTIMSHEPYCGTCTLL